MKKKIIRVSTTPSALNLFLRGQLKMLSEHYEVVAAASPGKELDIIAEREGVRTHAIPIERRVSLFKDFVSLIRLTRFFIKERPDIVHSLTPKAGLLSMMAAKIAGVPVRIHTFTGLIFPTRKGLFQKLLIKMDALTCWCATYINPEGEGVKNDLINYHVTSKPLHILGNGNIRGVDLKYFDCTDEVASKAAEYIDKNTFTFIFVGRLVGDKGINELVAAFDKLSNTYQHLRLFLVGGEEAHLDPLKDETLNTIKRNNQIYKFGNQTDVRPFLAASDLFVFPSYREGFPNSVLEAGAMRLPAVVTNISGCNEIIRSDVNGKIIEPRDMNALYEMMEYFLQLDKNSLNTMAENARNIIEKYFRQEIIWSELLKTYQEELNKHIK